MANMDDVDRLKGGGLAWNNWRQEYSDYRPNLSGANLSGANLSRADLSETNLSGANISKANLVEANLIGANLSGANLSGADLTGAYLSEANLSSADLTGANLSRANLTGANLTGAKLKDAIKLKIVDPLGRLWAEQEQHEEGNEPEPELTKTTSQTILTTTPLAGLGLTLFSVFVRLTHEAVIRNEPVLLNALGKMDGIRIVTERVDSFKEMAEHLAPEGLDREAFVAAFSKALAEDCAVIAIRNPLIDFGKDLVDKVFPGGTVFTAMATADSPQTFFAYVGTATVGLVIIRIGGSIAAGGNTIIQALANRIAHLIDPPTDKPAKDMRKPKQKDQ